MGSSGQKLHAAYSHRMQAFVYLLLIATAIGCSQQPGQRAIAFDSSAATAKALAQYDRDRDHKLSAQELKASAALSESAARIDKNRDGSLSEDEVRDRLKTHESLAGRFLFQVSVSLKGKPLAGAAVTFTPEAFMGEGAQSYVGKTGANGLCSLDGRDFKTLGVPNGFYEIRIIQTDHGIDGVRGTELANDVTRDMVEIEL
jgi:hypothetical protein